MNVHQWHKTLTNLLSALDDSFRVKSIREIPTGDCKLVSRGLDECLCISNASNLRVSDPLVNAFCGVHYVKDENFIYKTQGCLVFPKTA